MLRLRSILLFTALAASATAANADPRRSVVSFGQSGRGVVVSPRHVLTAGHVIIPFTGHAVRDAWLQGRSRTSPLPALGPGWGLSWAPKPGDYPVTEAPRLSLDQITGGRWNDLALLHASTSTFRLYLPAHIRSAPLAVGERTLIYDPDAGTWTSARVATLRGNNATLDQVGRALVAGLSGSPVFDQWGQLAGVLSARLDPHNQGLLVAQPLLGEVQRAIQADRRLR